LLVDVDNNKELSPVHSKKTVKENGFSKNAETGIIAGFCLYYFLSLLGN
jgi:hypothetical protein